MNDAAIEAWAKALGLDKMLAAFPAETLNAARQAIALNSTFKRVEDPGLASDFIHPQGDIPGDG